MMEKFVCNCVCSGGIMDNAVDVSVLVGAGFGALQMIGQFLMLFLPKNTIAFKVAKYIVSGPARAVPEA